MRTVRLLPIDRSGAASFGRRLLDRHGEVTFVVLLAAFLGAAMLVVALWQAKLRQEDQPASLTFMAPTILLSAYQDTAVIAADYRLPRAAPGDLYGWSVFGMPIADPDWALRVLRRDPRIRELSVARGGSGVSVPLGAVLEADDVLSTADHHAVEDALRTAGLTSDSCPTEVMNVRPLWPAWDSPLLAVGLRDSACRDAGIALWVVDERTAHLALLASRTMSAWLPPLPPSTVEGAAVERTTLLWGQLGDEVSGPLHPMWHLQAGGAEYLMLHDGTLDLFGDLTDGGSRQ